MGAFKETIRPAGGRGESAPRGEYSVWGGEMTEFAAWSGNRGRDPLGGGVDGTYPMNRAAAQ